MKHKGNRCQFIARRNRDLLNVIRALLGSRHFCRAHNVYAAAVNQPAPRFYVSEERAAEVLKRIDNGDPLNDMLPLRRRMFFDIKRMLQIRQRQSPVLSPRQLLCEVIHSTAPCFYLTPHSAMTILARHRKHRRHE